MAQVVSVVVAMDLNRVIGLNNQLPWKLPADQVSFKVSFFGSNLYAIMPSVCFFPRTNMCV